MSEMAIVTPAYKFSCSPEIPVLDDDQVRIGDVQRGAILGKSHLHDVLLASFSRETSERLVNVLIFKCACTTIGNRAVTDELFAIPHCPVRLKEWIIATAMIRLERTRSDTHHALHLKEREGLLCLN